MTRTSGWTIELPGWPDTAAVLALQGSAPRDLRRAIVLARAFDPEPLRIAVDGGLAAWRALRIRPDLFVGDGDSATAVPEGLDAVVYPTDKTFSDFAGALGEASRRGAGVGVVAGALGGRLDHEWANILELGAASRRFSALLATGARGLVVVTSRGMRARGLGRRVVSVFALGGRATVSLSGTRWPLARHRLAPGSRGLSNETDGRIALEVHGGVAAVVLPTR